MKRKIEIELYEEHDKVNFYTLRFEGEETEFDKFLDTFPDSSTFSDDVVTDTEKDYNEKESKN